LRVTAPIRRALDARNQCNRQEHRVVLGRRADLSALRTNMVGQNPSTHRSGAALFTARRHSPELTWPEQRFPALLIDAGAGTAQDRPCGKHRRALL